jgi:hypothetical protein
VEVGIPAQRDRRCWTNVTEHSVSS